MTLAHGKTQNVYEMESISGRSASRLTGRKARRVDRPSRDLLRARRNWVTEGRSVALTALSLIDAQRVKRSVGVGVSYRGNTNNNNYVTSLRDAA